ncbi:MAG: DUF1553 domain-containing protein [Bacteroidota bacterium]
MHRTIFPYRFLILAVLPVLLLGSTACQSDQHASLSQFRLPDKVDVNFHIKPILSDRCFKCHGPDEKAREADLRFDTEEGAFAALDEEGTQFAIVKGDVEASLLVQRISSTDPEEQMPPPASHLSLSAYEIALLKKWIEQGAEWKTHWAFNQAVRAELPSVRQASWVQTPIDQFVLARLEQEGVKPSPPASREKLIRRASFDLTGLPPQPSEIEAFLADQSPNAFEKVIDRFLASPAYGERMASEWLDVARYADSHGYQDDLERSMWPWRDWVIDAFNQNMPYDTFVLWQLAGDLLPNPTYEQQLATAFNRNHKITQEVGVIDEEYRVEYVVDRTHTAAAAFMGLTIECARCHDHKYDPISQKEYYQLFSFFNQVPERGRVEYGVEIAPPTLELPDETVANYKAYIRSLVSEQVEEIQTLNEQKPTQLPTPTISSSSVVSFPSGLHAYFPLDFGIDSLTPEATNRIPSARLKHEPVFTKGKFSGGLDFNGKNYVAIEGMRTAGRPTAFSWSMWLYSPDGGARNTIVSQWEQIGKKDQGIELGITGPKRMYINMRTVTNKSSIRLETLETFPENRWVHVGLTYDGSVDAAGFQIYIDGKAAEMVEKSNKRPAPFRKLEHIWLGKHPGRQGFFTGKIDEFSVFGRKLTEAEMGTIASYNPLEPILQSDEKERSETDRFRLQAAERFKKADYMDATERLREYKIREARWLDVVLKPTMVMQDMDSTRKTFVLNRGQYNAPMEEVFAGTPSHILSFPDSLPSNRLGLAQWLLHPENPLTARVIVNRYWQLFFGQGIVATPEDFGSQGDLPSHPALLDWMAIAFQQSGWNVKALHKLMLMSAVYQQSAAISQELQELDPENLLLARGPQTRLPAEMVRDHALAISGLLTRKVGGPSVKPYQPAGLWLEAASGNQPLRRYMQGHGEELYRRSLYTFWKRTVPPPTMMTFDAPTRNQCTVKRQATSTPLQALVMLNDPQFLEASREFGLRMIEEGGRSLEERIQFAFQWATSRKPSSKEISLLSQLFEEELTEFEQHPDRAEALLGLGEKHTISDLANPELAAYTMLANAVLNLTETIQKS